MIGLRILHLSDLHFGCPDSAAEQGRITDSIVNAVDGCIARDAREPDLVILSGDLAFSGNPNEFRLVSDWLGQLLEGREWPLFIVPGNHDAVRPNTSSKEYSDAYVWRATAAKRDGYELVKQELSNRQHLGAFWNWHSELATQLAVVSNWSTSRLACYWRKELNGLAVHLVGLNSALASLDGGDKDCLVADVSALNLTLRGIDFETELGIVVSHHPVLSSRRKGMRWLYRWNAERLSQLLKQRTGPHIYLHGHVHDSQGIAFSTIEGESLFVYGAGAAYQGSDWPQQFAFFDLDLQAKQITPKIHGYNAKSGTWEYLSSQSQPLTARLPRIPIDIRQDVQSKSSSGSGSGRISVEDLRRASDRGAARYVPQAAIHDTKGFTAWSTLFDRLLDGEMGKREYGLEQFLELLMSCSSQRWTVTGDPGAGKAELLATLYWSLRRRCNPRDEVMFFDLWFLNQDLGLERNDSIINVVENSQARHIVFVCGLASDPHLGTAVSQRLVDELSSRSNCVVVVAHHEHTDDARGPGKGVLPLRAPRYQRAVVECFVEAVSYALRAPMPPNWRSTTCDLVSSVCVAHGLPLSMYIVMECGRGVAENLRISTLSEILVSRLLRLPGMNESSIDELAKRAFEIFRSRANRAESRHEKMLPTPDDCSPELARFLAAHSSIEHMLIAHHAHCLLERLGGILANADWEKSVGEATELCRRLELVYPAHINSFAKEFFVKSINTSRRHITTALNAILNERAIGAGRLLKTHACYLIGRLPPDARHLDISDSLLLKVIEEAECQLQDVRALRASLRAANVHHSSGVLRHLESAGEALFGRRGTANLDQWLQRIGRELLLLQRSGYISLAYLSNLEAAEQYVTGLLEDADKDDMNRGFHLEYYGDVPYQPGEPLLSTDEAPLLACPNTFSALMEGLEKQFAGTEEAATLPPIAMIQAVTMASLARHRHAARALSNADADTIARCLRGVRDRFSVLNVKEFLSATIAELGSGKYVVERYIDGLYELKFQRRAGWGKLEPAESVAAHSYFVELLAKALVPERKMDQILRLVAFHDIGEAVTGDVPHTERTDECKAREGSVVRRMAFFGALMRSSHLMSVSSDYQAFEGGHSEEVRMARDLDKLDLLIQLMRYRRDNPSMPNYLEFRNHVRPENFGSPLIRSWAGRFLDYFDAQLSGNCDFETATQPLWPEKIRSISTWSRPPAAPLARVSPVSDTGALRETEGATPQSPEEDDSVGGLDNPSANEPRVDLQSFTSSGDTTNRN